MKERIYLDYNATAPLRPEAAQAMAQIMATPHNASSVHAYGRDARKLVEDARTNVAALVNVPPAQIIFNSGATETNNTVLKYFSQERILVSAIEHPSILEAAPNAEKIPVDRNGIVDLVALEKLLKEKKTALVSVMFVNNETGIIQPVEEISALAKRHGALFHCDAVQAAGRIKIDVPALSIDFLSLSSHKIGGPQGTGALVLGLCGITPVLLEGGGQEKKARAGTENVAAIAGFGIAASLADINEYKKLETLRNNLERELKKTSPDIIIHGETAPRAANTSLFSLPGAASETLLMAFDLENICISNGSACTSGTVKPSHVLEAMHAAPAGTVRVSMGWNTKSSDIDRFLEVWSKIYQRLKAKAHA